jgi:hypothetical protein
MSWVMSWTFAGTPIVGMGDSSAVPTSAVICCRNPAIVVWVRASRRNRSTLEVSNPTLTCGWPNQSVAPASALKLSPLPTCTV